MAEMYIGLMSGTSADGIDAALVDFSKSSPTIVETHYTPYTKELREKILSLCHPGENEIQRMGELDIILGKEFALAVINLLKSQSITHDAIKAIGSHGQTIRHHPHQPHRFTLQIGDPNTIAALTGITTVADFRRKDIAHGGQGAPLVPAFHQQMLSSSSTDRAIVNIGGIANITILPKSKASVIGYDTGPGNALMDGWIHTHQNESHDKNGDWGSQGRVDAILLAQMLADPYFHLPAPKSTGREHFNMRWLENQLQQYKNKIASVDVQATLTELTAQSIIAAIQQHISHGEILVCGGGAHNAFLMHRLHALAQSPFVVTSTKKYGIDPDWVEAIAFAWLAKQTIDAKPDNLPRVTGAAQETVLGGVYCGG